MGPLFNWDPWDPEKSQEFLNFVGLHKYLLYFNYKEKDKFDIIIQVKSHDFLTPWPPETSILKEKRG